MPRTALTRRQQAIYDYLRDHGNRFDYPPTLEELCRALGLRSRGSLHKHVQALIDAGLVEPMDRRQRGVRLRLSHTTDEDNGLPLLGSIAAGQPLEAVGEPQRLHVPALLRPRGGGYVLKVKGDSMVDAGILDGDWVIIEFPTQVRDGDIVVALIDNGEATLKRLERRRDTVLLHAANPDFPTLRYQHGQITIQGKMVGLLRRV